MHFNILALAALLATGVVGQDDAAVAKDTSVYFCKDTKFEGPCISIPANIDECGTSTWQPRETTRRS